MAAIKVICPECSKRVSLRGLNGHLRFEHDYASAPWTMPSVASLITGLYPTGHGVMTAMTGMSKNVHTLAEILRERGYRTGGVVSNHLIRSRPGRGFAQGYYLERGSEAGGHDHVSTDLVPASGTFSSWTAWIAPPVAGRKDRDGSVDVGPRRSGG